MNCPFLVSVVGKQMNSSPGQAPNVTSSNVLRKGSLQTKLNAGLLEQQQEDLFQSECSFHEVKLLTTRTVNVHV